ncbi:hypothetical protein PENSTE_c010G03566 [Penicillium steckii]|uniref:Uncharacterized protein n=1 Tax=Penicillium steckii TaxID=303698 RepID=A0A1V6T7U5_9EURO|nr:hypothetical protein PENSTE_c010G03566 [Penicillium steckii]
MCQGKQDSSLQDTAVSERDALLRISNIHPESSPKLLSYNELPDWYKDNEFIHFGYRPISFSTRACLSSWFYMHNETVNIYSHLLPGVFFVIAEGLMLFYIQDRYPEATVEDRLVFAFFLLTAVICLSFSAMLHTLSSHSLDVSNFWLHLDFIGIIVLTLGDFVSGIDMIFYCEPVLKQRYCIMITTLSLIATFILLCPKFQGQRWRTFRVCAFVGTGLSGIAPIAHGISIFGFDQMSKQSGMPYYLGEGSLLLLGAFFYTTRIPECLAPGKFVLVGSSHQWFHILVALATLIHLTGLIFAFDFNYHHRVCTGTFHNWSLPGSTIYTQSGHV